jgi:hypothetical protein
MRRIEDEAIRQVVKRQEAVGLKAVTDGVLVRHTEGERCGDALVLGKQVLDLQRADLVACSRESFDWAKAYT